MIRSSRVLALLGIGALMTATLLGSAAIAGAHNDHASKSKSKHPKPHSMANMPGMKASGKADDKGLSLLSNGHHAMIGTEEHALNPADRKTLSAQVAATIETAKKYPTAADALAAGYQQVGPYMPGIGAHYISYAGGQGLNPDGAMDDADLAHPLAIIYDGTEPTSVIAGFMYYSMSPKQPTGFAGANDVWHYHEDICLKFGPNGIETPYGLDKSATKKECTAAGANLMKQTQWMLHVWSVPGWESRQGLFGEVNPALMCADGSYYQLASKDWLTHKKNACKAGAA